MSIVIINLVVLALSGFFGEKTLIKVGGAMLPFGIGVMLATQNSNWLWWIGSWIAGLFIGYAIARGRAITNGPKPATAPYESEEDKFSAFFPTAPEVEHHSDTRLYKAGSHGVGYIVLVSNRGFTSITSYEEAVALETSPKKLEKAQRAELQKGLGVLQNMSESMVSTKNTGTFLGVPSAEAVYVNQGGYHFSKRFYVGDRGFQVTVAHSEKETAKAAFDEFIASFQLINN
jgi:hypothetical protein